MYRSPKEMTAFKGQLSYVDSCPEQPVNGKAFCENHCKVAEENGVPSGLQEFLKHCGIAKGNCMYVCIIIEIVFILKS